MNLKFAFAVNKENKFDKRYFGDADKYLIYEQLDNEMVLIGEEINNFKLFDEEHEHGSKKKGDAIIKFLKGKEVNVLVSMQFGKNIKIVNEYFIPIIIYSEKPEDTVNILNKHLHWIKDEWGKNKSNFKLFTIKAGILKSSIKK
jgi:predicted Fe-Mo cluster-binding NifX family protein